MKINIWGIPYEVFYPYGKKRGRLLRLVYLADIVGLVVGVSVLYKYEASVGVYIFLYWMVSLICVWMQYRLTSSEVWRAYSFYRCLQSGEFMVWSYNLTMEDVAEIMESVAPKCIKRDLDGLDALGQRSFKLNRILAERLQRYKSDVGEYKLGMVLSRGKLYYIGRQNNE